MGYHAFLEGIAKSTVKPNPLVHVTYSMAKHMLGTGVTTSSARRQAEALHEEGAGTSSPDTVNMPDTDAPEVGTSPVPDAEEVGSPPQPGPSHKRPREA